MTDDRRANDRSADDALRELFAGISEPRDDGFADRVMARIESRIRTRRLVLALAVLLGAGIALVAAWPLGQLLLTLSDDLGSLFVGASGTDWLTEYRTLIAGAVLAFLTPAVAALLED
jgi:anti-sigma factor RsiW